MSDRRPADVITLMWHNDDGTVTTETTDFTTTPHDVTTRVWDGLNVEDLFALERHSIVIPAEVTP